MMQKVSRSEHGMSGEVVVARPLPQRYTLPASLKAARKRDRKAIGALKRSAKSSAR
jgi:hypothetical protein